MKQVQKDKIKELLADESDKLSAWDIEFIESLDGYPQEYELSDKQEKCLDKIWSKCFG